jgi:glucokinase
MGERAHEPYSYPVLVADIGGTNARFAMVAAPGDAPRCLPKSRTDELPGPIDAAAHALRGWDGPPPRSALIGVATQVQGPIAHLTNAQWTVDAAALGAAFALNRVTLLNDFVPVATALVPLHARHSQALVRLGPEVPAGRGPSVVLGPGTGLGAAALIPAGACFVVQSTEAGHIDFGPCEIDEPPIFAEIDRVCDRHTAEAVLSGPGLLRLYHAHARSRGASPTCSDPKHVVDAGAAGDEIAAAALMHFARLLGRFAGDLALVFGAVGGVYIAGGIAPRIASVLLASDFRAAFERKAPLDRFVRAVPTWLIAHPDPAIEGLAAIAAAPERFLFQSYTWTA